MKIDRKTKDFWQKVIVEVLVYNLIVAVIAGIGVLLISPSLNFEYYRYFLIRYALPYVSIGIILGNFIKRPTRLKLNLGGILGSLWSLKIIFLYILMTYIGGGVGNNVLNGVERYYYPSGSLKWERPIRNGSLHGQEKFFYEDGGLDGYIEHRKGISIGAKSFYPEGQLKTETFYEKGKAVSGKVYNKDGSLWYTIEYGDDFQKEYYPDGKLKMEYVRVGGEKIMTEYDREGNVTYKGRNKIRKIE